MNKVISFSIAFAVICGVCTSGMAQSGVCVIDVAQIFKDHPTFNQQLAALKQEAEQFQAQLQQAGEKLAGMNEELRQIDPSTEEYQQQERQIAQLSASFEVDRRTKMRELMTREAKLHFDTYSQITEQIGSFCQENQIRLVLRYNNTEMDVKQPATIMQAVNSNVVFQNSDRDITAQVSQRVAASVTNNGTQNR